MTVKEWAELSEEWAVNADTVVLVKLLDSQEMKAKKICPDMPIIIQAQQEVHALNTYNSPHQWIGILCKMLTLDRYKTYIEASKRFIDKEEVNLIQLQDIDSISNKPENSHHFTKGSSER
jgi:hypothetical protein